MLNDLAAGRVQCSLDDGLVFDAILSDDGIEELISGLIAFEQNQAPDEVGEKAAD